MGGEGRLLLISGEPGIGKTRLAEELAAPLAATRSFPPRRPAAPVPLEPPREALSGDSNAHLLEPLQAFAESLGYAVVFGAVPGSTGGWCDANAKRIVVDANSANGRVRTLIHECAHAVQRS